MNSNPEPDPAPIPATQTLIQRYGALMLRIMQLVGGRYLRARTKPMLAKVEDAQGRVRSLSVRLRELMERIEAGSLKPYQKRKRAEATAVRKPRSPREKPAMGRGFGWLLDNDAPDLHEFNQHRDWIGELIGAAPTLELLGREPERAGRIVRPLCHMLMLQPPACFKLPPRARKPRMRKPKVPAWTPPWTRVPSAKWPGMHPAEAVPIRQRNRRRVRRQE